MKSGYAYQFRGGASATWRTSTNPDDWEIVVVGHKRAKFVGFRTIDGVNCTVWEHKGEVFAQTAASAPPPKGMK